MITDINKILVEWAYRTSDGKPDVKNKAKLLKLETVLSDFGWSREARAELLNTLVTGKKTLDEVKLLKNIVSKLKRVWTSLKGKIKSLFSKKIKGLDPGEETVIKIPGLKTENKIEYMNLKDLLNEGALQAIKGNYNEALTCQYIYGKDGTSGVGITPKYKSYKSEVDNIVKKWDTDLKNAVTKYYSSAKSII